MKLSYFTMPLHPLGRDYRVTLGEDRAAFLLADELGYAEAFVGEHVTDLAETITSGLMFLASLAYETKRIHLGSGTVNLPNAHPAAVAVSLGPRILRADTAAVAALSVWMAAQGDWG